MIRDRFVYHSPSSEDEAAELVVEHGDQAEVVAGGTWVVPEMTQGRRRPRRVVDLARAGLAGVARENGHLRIGPTTTYTGVERSGEAPTLLRDMARGITGGAQIRNQGTIGGSLCYANPASDAPGALAALGARVQVRGPDTTREVTVEEFVTGPFTTILADDELVTAILIPARDDGTRFGYVKFKLCESSWPIVTAGAAVSGEGRLVALAVGGAAPRPYSLSVDGLDDGDVEQAARDAMPEPYADVLASAPFRRHLAGVIAKRAVAAARASGGENDG
jgi:aerobic carbon-monoxide dehydrogenase medium subunit